MRKITLLFIFGFPACISANSSMSEFLLSAQADVNELGSSGANGAGMSVASSWLEEAQFRFNATEGNDFDAKERSQSYEIRVKPKAWGQREIEESILDLRSNQQNNNYNLALNAALKKRYLVLLAYLEQRNITQYLFNLANLSAQEVGLIRSDGLTDRFNPEKLFDAVEMSEQSRGLAALNLVRLNTLQTQIGLPLDTADSVQHTSAMVNIVDFVNMSDQVIALNNTLQFAPDVQDKRLALEMVQAKSKLVKAEHQFGVNLLSFTYKESRNDNMDFQVGINLPLGTHFSKAESQYKVSKAQTYLENHIVMIKQSLMSLEKEIAWLRGEVKLADMQILRVQKYLATETVNMHALLVVSLRKELIEHKKKRHDIQLKALERYLDSLALSGVLIQQPLRNWMQKGTPELVSGERG